MEQISWIAVLKSTPPLPGDQRWICGHTAYDAQPGGMANMLDVGSVKKDKHLKPHILNNGLSCYL